MYLWEAAKKSSSLNGRAIKALPHPPPASWPLELNGPATTLPPLNGPAIKRRPFFLLP